MAAKIIVGINLLQILSRLLLVNSAFQIDEDRPDESEQGLNAVIEYILWLIGFFRVHERNTWGVVVVAGAYNITLVLLILFYRMKRRVLIWKNSWRERTFRALSNLLLFHNLLLIYPCFDILALELDYQFVAISTEDVNYWVILLIVETFALQLFLMLLANFCAESIHSTKNALAKSNGNQQNYLLLWIVIFLVIPLLRKLERGA